MDAVDLAGAWHPYDRQAAFITSRALFCLFLGGVGSGKSHALVRWLLLRALLNGAATGALLGRTSIDLQTVLLPELFDALDQLHEATGWNVIADYDKGNASLTLVNGGVIYFRPYNRISKLRGLTLTYAAADEIEWSEADPEEVWSVLTGRLRGRGPAPGIAFATSPNGLRGITKRFYDAQLRATEAEVQRDARALEEARRFHVVTATSFDNPFLPPHFFDSLRSMSRKRYQQEVLGRVLRPTTAIYDIEPRHLVDHVWNPRLPWVLGVDWGGQSHHLAVAFQVEPSGRWVCADELVRDDMPRGRFQQELFKFIDEKGVPVVAGTDRAVVDMNQGLQMRYPTLPVRWLESKDEQRVIRGIEAIHDMLDPYEGEPRMVFSRRLTTIVRGETAPVLPAMRGYRYVQAADGTPTGKPLKDNVNDHGADAVRYAVMSSSGIVDLHGGRRWVIDPNDQRKKPEPQGAGWSSPHTRS